MPQPNKKSKRLEKAIAQDKKKKTASKKQITKSKIVNPSGYEEAVVGDKTYYINHSNKSTLISKNGPLIKGRRAYNISLDNGETKIVNNMYFGIYEEVLQIINKK